MFRLPPAEQDEGSNCRPLALKISENDISRIRSTVDQTSILQKTSGQPGCSTLWLHGGARSTSAGVPRSGYAEREQGGEPQPGFRLNPAR